MSYDLAEELCPAYTHSTTRAREKCTTSHVYLFLQAGEPIKIKLRYTRALYWNGDAAYESDAAGSFTFQIIEPNTNYLIYFPLNPGERRLSVLLEYFTGRLPAKIIWAPDCVVDGSVRYVEILPYDAVDIRKPLSACGGVNFLHQRPAYATLDKRDEYKQNIARMDRQWKPIREKYRPGTDSSR